MPPLGWVLPNVVDDFGPNSLAVGRVVAARVDGDVIREAEVSDGALIEHAPLLPHIAPGRHATIETGRPSPFPAGFKR